jgi:hypothetical protein
MEKLQQERVAYLKAEEVRKQDETRKLAHALEVLAATNIDMKVCAQTYRDQYIRHGRFDDSPPPDKCTAGPIRVANAYRRGLGEMILQGPVPRDIERHLSSKGLHVYEFIHDRDADYYVCVKAASLFN